MKHIAITFRKVNEKDLMAISEIKSIVQESTYAISMPQKLLNKNYLVEKNRFLFLAEFKGTPIGYIHSKIENNTGRIVSIFILPEFQNKGIGKNLMSNSNERFMRNNINYVDLNVVNFNKNAINFYKKWGYKIRKGEYKKELSNGLIKIKMYCYLNKE